MHDVRDEAIRIATQDDQTLAARHEREHGKIKTTDDAQKLAGEENQDDGGKTPRRWGRTWRATSAPN